MSFEISRTAVTLWMGQHGSLSANQKTYLWRRADLSHLRHNSTARRKGALSKVKIEVGALATCQYTAVLQKLGLRRVPSPVRREMGGPRRTFI